jgi:hypothetical protein
MRGSPRPSLQPFLLRDRSGASAIVLVAIIFAILLGMVLLNQTLLSNRTKAQGRFHHSLRMQQVLEEMAKYLVRARDLKRQAVVTSSPCPAGTRDSELVATAGYVPGVNPYPLPICWAPAGTGPFAQCVGIQYEGRYYCLAPLHAHARRDPMPQESPGSWARLEAAGSQEAPPRFALAREAYADLRTEGQWPPNNGQPLAAGVRADNLPLPGTAQGYGDNHCGANATGPERCISITLCPENEVGPGCLGAGASSPARMLVRLTGLDP